MAAWLPPAASSLSVPIVPLLVSLAHAGGSALSTLCCQPGTHKQVPLVVHSSQGSLYEVRRPSFVAELVV